MLVYLPRRARNVGGPVVSTHCTPGLALIAQAAATCKLNYSKQHRPKARARCALCSNELDVLNDVTSHVTSRRASK